MVIKTLLALAAILLIESVLIVNASMVQGQYRVRGFMIINMMLIAAFSPKLFAVGQFVSNYGNAFYASVFCIQCLTLRRFGYEAAIANLWPVLTALATYYVLSGILGLAPAAPWPDALSVAVNTLTMHQFSAAAASALAFLAGQAILLDVGRRYTAWWGLPFAVVLGQFVDSAIFFPIAFVHLPVETLLNVVVLGFAAKVLFAVVLVPAYMIACRQPIGGLPPGG